MFYVYILKSEKDGKLYIGFTSDLRKRLQQHNKGKSMSTKYRGSFRLVYYEAYTSKNDAEEQERKLKRYKNSYTELKKRIFHGLHES